MSQDDQDSLKLAIEAGYSKHPRNIDQVISYGTAGFRTRANLLDSVVFRVGIIATLRSRAKHGLAIGIMVTASHNPEEDNGVKIVDPAGEMLESTWEGTATSFANLPDDAVVADIDKIVKENEIDLSESATVVIGRDTRESSPALAKAAADGVRAAGGTVLDFGVLTTPQLHYIVRCYNDPNYGEATEDGYFDKLSKAFIALNDSTAASKYEPSVSVDCANGVGAPKLQVLAEIIKEKLSVKIFNAGDGKLNSDCGADYVKLYQKVPTGSDINPGTRYASFDGDADRIVYFYLGKEDNSFHLLDGDKIALLYVYFLKNLLDEAGLAEDLSFCMVQTAYANGSSTLYVKEKLRVETSCTPTGVKHLHHRAQDSDVSVYFEANGHGTVLFSGKAADLIECAAADGNAAASKLAFTVALINQTTGDAISDFLLVETILRQLDWSVEDWDALYSDLPSRQLKVQVSDRNRVSTTDAERQCVRPDGLQDAINAYVRKLGPNARCFVRPSGTEDIVRVYAESETQEKADALAEAVASAVRELVDED